jgi:DNA-binding NarL/FixJ family response regulator
VFAAMRAGAKGYLLKDSGGQGVLHAIRAMASGEAVFGPGVAERIVGFFTAPRPAQQRAFPELTEREEEVLSLLAEGKNNQQIARRLYLSIKTVRNHVSNILLKLQVADRTQAVIRARDAGMGQDVL